jgi:hypothetical protein
MRSVVDKLAQAEQQAQQVVLILVAAVVEAIGQTHSPVQAAQV